MLESNPSAPGRRTAGACAPGRIDDDLPGALSFLAINDF